MRKLNYAMALLLSAASTVSGAVVTFDPPHVSNLVPGTDVQFDITVAVESLSGFNWADIIIGINEEKADISFQYSDAWDAAFDNVSPVTYDVGSYMQDAYVGGNNPDSVGTELVLGTATVDTTHLSAGTYEVIIDSSDGVTALGLNEQAEALSGSGTFEVIPEPTSLFFLITSIALLRRARARR